jgi:hypothetical protein
MRFYKKLIIEKKFLWFIIKKGREGAKDLEAPPPSLLKGVTQVVGDDLRHVPNKLGA